MNSRLGTGPYSLTDDVRYKEHMLLPYLWQAHHTLADVINQRTSYNRSQCNALRDQFRQAILNAEACASQNAGQNEIKRLTDLLSDTCQYFANNRDQQWTHAMYGVGHFESFISDVATALDHVFQGMALILRTPYRSTVEQIKIAREKDENSFRNFVTEIDRASPMPGGFTRALDRRDVNELHSLTDRVFREQTQILTEPQSYPEEEVQGAEWLTGWIMNITKQRIPPDLILGRRFVGERERINSTKNYDIYRSKFVTGETVVIKAMRHMVNGKDIAAQLPRFLKEVRVWQSLRCDQTLPFYGIGKSDRLDGQVEIFCVAPYMKNGDAVFYQSKCHISASDSLRISLDVATGLRYMHDKSPPVAHLGVRTDNVLISDSGRGILAGFGLSREVSDDVSTALTGFTNDSYRFVAPEHLEQNPFPRKPSADVWSWAMVALHLVGGDIPYCGASDLQAATLILSGQRPKRETYPRIEGLVTPDDFWELLQECWAQQELQRPSMDDVVYKMKKMCNELGRREPPIASAPARGTSIDEKPVDGQRQPAVEQGRTPKR